MKEGHFMRMSKKLLTIAGFSMLLTIVLAFPVYAVSSSASGSVAGVSCSGTATCYDNGTGGMATTRCATAAGLWVRIEFSVNNGGRWTLVKSNEQNNMATTLSVSVSNSLAGSSYRTVGRYQVTYQGSIWSNSSTAIAP
jgi:hypothetical protein